MGCVYNGASEECDSLHLPLRSVRRGESYRSAIRATANWGAHTFPPSLSQRAPGPLSVRPGLGQGRAGQRTSPRLFRWVRGAPLHNGVHFLHF